MQIIRNLALALIASLILVLAGCTNANGIGDSLAPADNIYSPSSLDDDPTPIRLDTILSTTETRAGESVHVQCLFYNEAGRVVEGEETILIVSRDVPSTPVEHGFHMAPTQAGGYQISCTTLNSDLTDNSPASLRVLPNLPFSWTVDLQDENCFHLDLHIPISIIVQDAYGNKVSNVHANVTSIPQNGFEGDVESGIRFTQEGNFDISITLVGELADGATIETFARNIHVDETGPTVSIDAPMRGEMIQMGTESNMDVTILGSATDQISSIVNLTVNDVQQDIAAGISTVDFETTYSSRWGLSVVTGTAEDECGNIGHISHGFLRSESYYDPALHRSPEAAVFEGAIAQINQSLLNDDDRTDIDDVATLVEIIVGGLDLNETIAPGQVLQADPYAESCDGGDADTSYSISRHPDSLLEVTMSGPWITELRAVDGGLDFSLRVADVAFPLQVNATASTCILTDITWVDVTLGSVVGLDNLEVEGTFGIDYFEGRAHINLDSFDADFEGTFVDLDCGLLDFACDLVTTAARDLIEFIIETTLEAQVRNTVPTLLEQTLQGLAIEEAIELPAPLNSTLNVVAQPAAITVCGPDSEFARPASCDPSQNAGSVLVGLTTQFFPESVDNMIPHNARGSISRTALAPEFNDSDYSFGVALRDDMLNQLFWAMWYGGGLNVDIANSFSEILPDGIEHAYTEAVLPPVIMPGTDGNTIDIGIGDLKVTARFDMNSLLNNNDVVDDEPAPPYFIDIELYISLIMGGAIDIDPTNNQLVLLVDPSPEFFFHVVSINNGAYSQEAGAILQGILPRVLPELLAQALSSYSLPQIDLSGVAGLPEGTAWELGNAELTHSDGYVQITGSVDTAQ